MVKEGNELRHKNIKRTARGQHGLVGLPRAKGRRTLEETSHVAVARAIDRYAKTLIKIYSSGPLGLLQTLGLNNTADL